MIRITAILGSATTKSIQIGRNYLRLARRWAVLSANQSRLSAKQTKSGAKKRILGARMNSFKDLTGKLLTAYQELTIGKVGPLTGWTQLLRAPASGVSAVVR